MRAGAMVRQVASQGKLQGLCQGAGSLAGAPRGLVLGWRPLRPLRRWRAPFLPGSVYDLAVQCGDISQVLPIKTILITVWHSEFSNLRSFLPCIPS